MNKIVPLSKFLAVVLRHHPEDFGITLDEFGFTPLDPVWQAIQAKFGNRYTHQDLLDVVAGDKQGKKRYEIVHGKIRAMYGHSAPEVSYPPIEPPDLLYHGTSPQAAQKIKASGLQSLGRQYVHLTTSIAIASTVAIRHASQSVLLTIRAKEAHEAGIVFHQAEAEHYLVKHMPPRFIEFP